LDTRLSDRLATVVGPLQTHVGTTAVRLVGTQTPTTAIRREPERSDSTRAMFPRACLPVTSRPDRP
jgi:hypothetical protein